MTDAKPPRSLFLDFFGDKPNFRIIDFLMENRLQDFTKTEIARGADVSKMSLFNHWVSLEKHRIVKRTRTVGRIVLYQLDESSPIVQRLKEVEISLMKQTAEAQEERIAMKAHARPPARRSR